MVVNKMNFINNGIGRWESQRKIKRASGEHPLYIISKSNATKKAYLLKIHNETLEYNIIEKYDSLELLKKNIKEW
jgi:hypothetical protein